MIGRGYMYRFGSASLLLVFSCACAAAEVQLYKAQAGSEASGFPRFEDIPPLFPVVNRLVWIRWHEGEKPNPVEVLVHSSRAGYQEITFTAVPSVPWLHVTPNAATTPVKLSVSVDPAMTDAVGEVVISAPGSKWEPVHVRVATEIIEHVHSEVAAAVNGASFSVGIAPGAVVTLFGSHLGPDEPAVAKLVDGAYETEVAKTTFKLDGVPCPILYVSGGQTSIIMPYGIQAGKHILEIANIYAGNTYAGTILLDITLVAPGIFTLLANGRGPAAALNDDYSLNTIANPATRGSYIVLYATGLGELESRPARDGAPETRMVLHKTVPTASVGMKPAFVYYAGSAPGLVSAVSQVNVQIPPDAPSGEVELKLTSGTTSSQNGVTIFIK